MNNTSDIMKTSFPLAKVALDTIDTLLTVATAVYGNKIIQFFS